MEAFWWLFGESIVKFMAVSFNLRDIFFFGNGWKNHGHFIFSEPKIIMSAWEAQHFIIFTQKTRESNRIGALEFLKS